MNRDIEFLEETHEYLVDGVLTPSVSTIISPIASFYYDTLISTSYDSELTANVVKKACKRGNAIHKATEDLDLGKEYEIEDKWKDYVLQYKKFKAIKKPEIIEIEKQLTDGQVCGTIDRVMVIDGVRWLVDIKTSSAINTILIELQEGGYSRLAQANDLKIDKFAVLHLTKTNYKFQEITPNIYMFEILLKNYITNKEIEKYKKENIK